MNSRHDLLRRIGAGTAGILVLSQSSRRSADDPQSAGDSPAAVQEQEMVNCNQMGEAAGVASCLAWQVGDGVAEIAPNRLRRVLAEGGSVIL